jgi:hypothetical protein
MKKKIVGILVVTLLIAATVLPVAGTMNISKNEEETSTESEDSQNQNHVIPDSKPRPRPIPRVLPPWLMAIFNNDWDYWSNPPNIYLIPSGNVGIGTTTPSEKLEVNGNVQVNGMIGSNQVTIFYVSATHATPSPYWTGDNIDLRAWGGSVYVYATAAGDKEIFIPLDFPGLYGKIALLDKVEISYLTDSASGIYIDQTEIYVNNFNCNSITIQYSDPTDRTSTSTQYYTLDVTDFEIYSDAWPNPYKAPGIRFIIKANAINTRLCIGPIKVFLKL